VRWVAVAVVSTTLACLAAIGTGAIAPQVEVGTAGSGPTWFDDTLVLTVRVENQAALGTDIVGAGSSAPGVELTGVVVDTDPVGFDDLVPSPSGAPAPSLAPVTPEPGATIPDGGVTIGRGQSVDVVLRYALDCEHVASGELTVPIRLRTPLGLTRTVDATHATFWEDDAASAVDEACAARQPVPA
jgi:hypothetical protein